MGRHHRRSRTLSFLIDRLSFMFWPLLLTAIYALYSRRRRRRHFLSYSPASSRSLTYVEERVTRYFFSAIRILCTTRRARYHPSSCRDETWTTTMTTTGESKENQSRDGFVTFPFKGRLGLSPTTEKNVTHETDQFLFFFFFIPPLTFIYL